MDTIVEHPSGDIVGIEVKAGATVRPQDFNGLAHVRDRVGKHLRAGCATVLAPKLAQWRVPRQYGVMPSIQIKDVPEETHAVLRQRAAAARQSLQEYLRGRLIDEAGTPTLDEILDRAGGRAGGSVPFSAAAEALREDRARR